MPWRLSRAENSFSAEDNENCFKCHGQSYFNLVDEESGTTQKRLMCDKYVLSRDDFYQSNHWNFACTDCHSPEFANFPHQIVERLEEHFNCIDCHGYGDFCQVPFRGRSSLSMIRALM
ncbi:MAG: hypothetical protein R2727_03425 [Bacteroidales bacterium]